MVTKYKPRIAVKVAISSVGNRSGCYGYSMATTCYNSNIPNRTRSDIAFTASWSLILHIQQSGVTDM